MSATARSRGFALVAAAAGLGLLASPLALTSGALADDASASSKSATKAAAKAARNGPVKLDLFAINDFHGQIEKVPSTSSGGRVATPAGNVSAGGAEYLATHLKEWRSASRASGAKPITVAAGDLIGASPLLSAAFHDEPAIETMNMLGLRMSSVGNHEFDEGYRELLRMQRGGCLNDGPTGANNQNSCPTAAMPFDGADFNYLAANVKKTSTRKTILAPYTVRKVDGERVAFIGMTLEDTPNIVTKSGVQGLKFTDEVNTANALVPEIRKQGIKAIVVLLHEGVTPSPITDLQACENAAGPALEIGKRLDKEIDLVVSGHTHQPYICTVKDQKGRPRLITSAYSTGRVVTEINLELDQHDGQVLRSATKATNHIVTNEDGTAADAAVTALINRYSTLVAPIRDKVLGQLAPAETVNAFNKESDGTDYELGNLIADSQKKDPSVDTDASATPVIAFMNPGGIRTNLIEDSVGNVTYGAAFAVQPFNNYVTSFDLTGTQILAVLNEQWNGLNEGPTANKILQISGLQYTWDRSDAALADTNAVVGDVLIDENGDGDVTEVLDPNKTYRVAANSFLADGGDGFATFAASTDKYIGGLDIDALALELTSGTGAYVAPPTGRIVAQD